MTQSNDNLESRVNHLENGQIDLRLAVSAMIEACNKNSADIADLMQVARSLVATQQQHAAHMARLDAIVANQDEKIARLDAANERLDRIIDYLIRRDRSDS